MRGVKLANRSADLHGFADRPHQKEKAEAEGHREHRADR